MKNFFLLTVSFIMAVLLSGCFDETKSLIVFDNIGMKRSTLGIYQNKENGNNKLISLCYKNSKYYAKYILSEDDGSNIAFLEGKFVPSQVTGTDLHILSFPELSGYSYNIKKKIKYKDIFVNAIIYYKIENNSFLLWMDFLSDSDEKKSSNEIKQIIKKSYSKTLTNGSTNFLKVGNCSSANELLLKIEKMKQKYSYFKEKK